MNARRTILGLLTAAGLACACTVGPDYRKPVEQTPDVYQGRAATQPASAPSSQPIDVVWNDLPVDLAQWWLSFNDPVLNDVIARALQANLDLRLAVARVAEARGQRGVVYAAEWPIFNTGAGYTYNRVSQNTVAGEPQDVQGLPGPTRAGVRSGTFGPGVASTPPSIVFNPISPRFPSVTVTPGGGGGLGTIQVNPPLESGGRGGTYIWRDQQVYGFGFDTTWEIDVFGGVRRAIEAADADLSAAIEARNDVLVTLLGDVARAYMELRGFQERIRIANKNIDAQSKTLDLVRRRYRVGLSNDLDVAQAETLLATTTAQVPPLQVGAQTAQYRLEVLLDLPPGALNELLRPYRPIPIGSGNIPVGLPSDLLQRRPDIRAAERQLAAATARIGVATADLFPKFSLTGSFGVATKDLHSFLNANSFVWGVGPAVSWPIFDAGRIVSNIVIADARVQGQLVQYRRTLLLALLDVESALVAYTQEKLHYVALDRAVAASRRTVSLSQERFEKGLVDFLNVLNSEQSLYTLEDQLAQSQTTLVISLVATYKALGGGWDPQASDRPLPMAMPLSTLRSYPAVEMSRSLQTWPPALPVAPTTMPGTAVPPDPLGP